MSDYLDFFADDVCPTQSEMRAARELEIFRKLAATGILSVNLSMLPAPLFRIMVHIPYRAIDRYGRSSHRDNFFFSIRYPRVFGQSPSIAWPADADVPAHPNFCRAAIYYSSLTFEQHLAWLTRPTFRGAQEMDRRRSEYPSVALALDVCTALDKERVRDKIEQAGLGAIFLDWIQGGRESASTGPSGIIFEEPQPPFEAPLKPRRKFEIKRNADVKAEAYRHIDDIANRASRLDTLSDSPGAPLFILLRAYQAMHGHIGWSRSTAANRVEQGGLLIGEVVQGPRGVTCLATGALPAHGTRGSAAYVKFDHQTWKAMFDEFDELVRRGQIGANQTIIGWYHTHPNMNVFMSSTDMETQRSLFGKPWNYALVLNPQQERCGCFRGEMAIPAPLIEATLKGAADRLSRPLSL